jgi:hypothetical protein
MAAVVTRTPFPLALSDFQARYPEFKATSTTLISATLNDAALMIDACVWGALAGQGHGYLTAHRLALSPFGQQARMVAKDGKTTSYWLHYIELVKIVGSGFRVL